MEEKKKAAPFKPQKVQRERAAGGSPPRALIWGRQAVVEALRAQSRPIHKVLVAQGARESRIQEIVSLSRAANIPLQRTSRKVLDQLAPGQHHQGVVALVAVREYTDPEDLLAHLTPQSLLVVLDEVQDPHNLGAIIRTAYGAGSQAVVITKHHSAGLSEAVAKASAGAVEYLPVARVTNLASFLTRLKEAGLQVIGVEPDAPVSYCDYLYQSPLAIVFGSERGGLRRLTRERCDQLVSIPLRGQLSSLNVSVAVGIVLFEILRQQGV